MEATLRRFAEISDEIASKSGKIEKTTLLAAFLGELPEDDLYWAALYFTGAAFPRSSGRVLQVGFAGLQAAALSITGMDAEAFDREYLRWSDVGDTLAAVWGERSGDRRLTLSQLAAELESLASTPAGIAKTLALTHLFRELDAAEVRYVAKILTTDLRIGLKQGLVEDAIARAFGVKPAEVRKAHQLVGDLGRIAVAAKHGTLESLQVVLFTPLKPMLATAEASPAAIAERVGPELWIEDKYDGIRAQVHRTEERTVLYSRDLKDVSDQFPEVMAALERIPGSLILDGELLAYRNGAALPFFDLQKRLGRKSLTQAVLTSVPVVFMAFDLLYQDGEPLLDHPFRERRVRLEALPRVPGFELSPLRVRRVDELEEEFTAAKSRANEGLMVKQPDSLYAPGRRGMSWLKYKKPLEPLDVVVTGVEYGHGRRRDVLSDYTFAVRNEEDGALVNIGKAYTGLTDAEILELTEYFKSKTIQSFGRFQQVEPELVIEVAFEAIQRSPRHKSGYALRFPRIVRLRPDRTPADINTLADVARLYDQYRLVYDGAPAESDGE